MAGQDMPMNGFPIVTSADYVYVELANGSQGKIKKSDLIGLFNNIYVSRAHITGDTLLSTANECGCYFVRECSDSPYPYAMLMVDKAESQGFIIIRQEIFDYMTWQTKTRIIRNGVESPWR